MKNLFSFVVILSSVIFLSACSGEESVLMASLPETPAEKPEVPEEDEEFINWEYSHSTVVKNETTLSEDGVVDSTLKLKTYTQQCIWVKKYRKIRFAPIISARLLQRNGVTYLLQ